MAQYVQTTTFANGASADGGQVNTEVVALGQSVNNIVDAQIDASAAIAMSKIADYTAWTAYTPTLTQTGAVTKNILNCRYMQIGKIVFVQGHLLCTGAGTGGAAIVIGLPVNSVYDDLMIGVGNIYNADLNTFYSGYASIPSGSNSTFILRDTTIVAGNGSGLGTSSVSFALAANDQISFSIQYEVA